MTVKGKIHINRILNLMAMAPERGNERKNYSDAESVAESVSSHNKNRS
jgi:hypothetical protein